jgi:two-component system, NtrC family, sensor kinase
VNESDKINAGGDDPRGGRLPVTKSLRGKAWLFTLVLAVYFVIVTVVVGFERWSLQESVALLQDLNEREERLVGLNYAVSRAVISINENYFSPDIETSGKMLALEVEALLPAMTRLQAAYPILAEPRGVLAQVVDELSSAPTRASIADLRGTMHRLVLELDLVTADVATQKVQMVERYQRSFIRITQEWISFGVLALILIAWVFKAFLRGLAVDIDRVRKHATAIVRGGETGKLEHNRKDELGMLMDAVNTMQEELAKRDNQIEFSRQQSFHKEKMAAIGSLAAAVAHEINNPLSAIVGVAQAIDHECQSEACALYGAACHPEMILDQAKRVIQITRQISEFSVPQSQDPEFIDINGLLRSTVNFVKFDRRFRTIDVVVDLDTGLPAVYAIADHLVQVAMNLLINAADALHGKTGAPPQIRVITSRHEAQVLIQVIDNGEGISPENLPMVFVERFSTKAPGRGSGLGLSLCRSLIEKAGGAIDIESALGQGTEVRIRLPIPVLGVD